MSDLAVVLEEKRSFSVLLVKKVEDYFRDEENRKRFENWYKNKYGNKDLGNHAG